MKKRSRADQQTYSANHYARHRPRVLRQQRKRRDAMYEHLAKLKAKPCADCGMQYSPWVMDFDHVRGKKLFGLNAPWSHSWRTMLKEIAKCDVVCSNCHRQRTHDRALVA